MIYMTKNFQIFSQWDIALLKIDHRVNCCNDNDIYNVNVTRNNYITQLFFSSLKFPKVK